MKDGSRKGMRKRLQLESAPRQRAVVVVGVRKNIGVFSGERAGRARGSSENKAGLLGENVHPRVASNVQSCYTQAKSSF